MAFHVFQGQLAPGKYVYYIGTSISPKPLVLFRSLDDLIKYFPAIDNIGEVSFQVPCSLVGNSASAYEPISANDQSFLLRALGMHLTEGGEGRASPD